MRVRLAAVTALLAVSTTVAIAQATPAASVQSGVTTLSTITDAGTPTTFDLYWARPSAGTPKAAVVVFHGHGHNADEWQAELASVAARNGALAVAAQTEPSATSAGPFDSVNEEARNSAAAIDWVHRVYPKTRPLYLLCVSMGCSGMADFLSDASRRRVNDPDANWVQQLRPQPITGILISEGLSNLSETWAEAAAADPTSRAEIEQEARTASGPASPVQNPRAYEDRSFALLTPGVFRWVNIQTAAVVHDVDDGLVPANQAIESRVALARAKVPFHGYTVLRDPACDASHQTTGTSYVSDELDKHLCLAGHATETHPETPVMDATFDVLHLMISSGVGRGESTLKPNSP